MDENKLTIELDGKKIDLNIESKILKKNKAIFYYTGILKINETTTYRINVGLETTKKKNW